MKRYEPWYVLGEVSGNASKRYSLLRAAEHTARRELIERELKREVKAAGYKSSSVILIFLLSI